MTQQFKFGDIVKSREYIALLDKPLCFFRYSEKSDWAECLEQDGTFHFLKVEDLELIPHPDTARLDWLESQGNLRVTTLHSHSGVRASPVEISYRIKKTDYVLMKNIIFKNFNILRQTIDNAMQQEQTK